MDYSLVLQPGETEILCSVNFFWYYVVFCVILKKKWMICFDDPIPNETPSITKVLL